MQLRLDHQQYLRSRVAEVIPVHRILDLKKQARLAAEQVVEKRSWSS